jgi:NhaP-type Na+/H+ or K+/H+ antiporter
LTHFHARLPSRGRVVQTDQPILAAILAPTDAGLGTVIVNSERVPARIRQALNVEAGLNDGLAVPFLMLFIALAAQTSEGAHTVLGRFLLEQLGYGTLIGLGVGAAGGWLLDAASRRDWMAAPMAQLGLVALPLLCMLLSEETGASMFIAAFVGGLAVQIRFRNAGKHSIEFTEEWGQLFDFFVFFLFGLVVARDAAQFSAAHFVYAALSLTVVRVAPVALAPTGRGQPTQGRSCMRFSRRSPLLVRGRPRGYLWQEGEANAISAATQRGCSP